MALVSACSSQSSDRPAQESNARAKGAAGLAAQAKANEAARLARTAQAKDGALLFVTRAQNACRELTRKIEGLTMESTVGFSELDSFIPLDLYPTDPFSAYVNERASAEVRSQLTQLVGSVVELLRSLERRQATALQEKKLKALASTDTYCESVRAAGAGVGALR